MRGSLFHMAIRTKRAYENVARSDGRRILVDRLWPRGLPKGEAGIDVWAKAVAPSDALRRWYRHDPRKWPAFKRRYFAELDANAEAVADLLRELGRGTATFAYGSKEDRRNNAVALKEYVEARGRGRAKKTRR